MDNKGIARERVLAICYDFDKTLSPTDMQAQGYIQSVGYDVQSFWKKSNGLAKDNKMDQNLAYMLLMKDSSRGKIVFTKQKLEEYGSKVELFPGVEEWFSRINEYGNSKGIEIEHYIISSGLKEMIEGTSLGKRGVFKEIYASSFYYDDRGEATWPAQVVNYTNKTQFLFRIEKGTLDVNDSSVNDYFPSDKIRVPFRNMIYIGDSDTDVPCMKLVNSKGGYSIGVFDPRTNNKTKVYKMLNDNRIQYFLAADYTDGSQLDCLVKTIIDKTVSNEKLEQFHENNKIEVLEFEKETSAEQQLKNNLMNELEDSFNFSRTHKVIGKMEEISEWNQNDVDRLCFIALNNSQVRYILSDGDVNSFFRRVIQGKNSERVDELKKYLGDA